MKVAFSFLTQLTQTAEYEGMPMVCKAVCSLLSLEPKLIITQANVVDGKCSINWEYFQLRAFYSTKGELLYAD